MFRHDHVDDAGFFNRSRAALCSKVYQQARKHSGRLSASFEQVRSCVRINLFDSWQSLHLYVGNPASRPRPCTGLLINTLHLRYYGVLGEMMKLLIAILFTALFTMSTCFSSVEMDTPATLAIVASVLSLNDDDPFKQAEKTTDIAHENYLIEKKYFFNAFDNALENKKNSSQVSRIFSACYLSKIKTINKYMSNMPISSDMISSLPPKKASLLLWKISRLAIAPQTPAVRLASHYVGMRVVLSIHHLHRHQLSLFIEKQETASYLEETQLFQHCTKELNMLK